MAEPAGGAEVSSPLDLRLRIGDRQVSLWSADGGELSASCPGVSLGLQDAVDDVRRARGLVEAWARQQNDDGGAPVAHQAGLAVLGERLAESFLPGEVAETLAEALSGAARVDRRVRVGVVAEEGLARLPWEALPDPGSGRPLALLSNVDLYRHVDGGAVGAIPGPLRVLVAIASPDDGGPGFGYERELHNVLQAVRSARAHGAHVRVVRFATTTLIREALVEEPFHVLHVSARSSPGAVQLEDADGGARPVSIDRFVEEAIPPGRMPPVIGLAACSTHAATVDGAPSFAARLLARGAAVVVTAETSVTDRYATGLFAKIYEDLAASTCPDAVAAVAEARREMQRGLSRSTSQVDRQLAALDGWATVTVFAGRADVIVFDPTTVEPVSAGSRSTLAFDGLGARVSPRSRAILAIADLGARRAGEVVGRRREQWAWSAELLSGRSAGIVMHGIGGIGKTALAAELTARVREREPQLIAVAFTGAVSMDRLLGDIATVVRTELLVAGNSDDREMRALDRVCRAGLPWEERFALLQEVLARRPVLVVLDDFEENLTEGPDRAVRDESLAALLAAWVSQPGLSRFLVASRHGFWLLDGAWLALSFRPMEPLSQAETLKLAWLLPMLDRLTTVEIETVWRLVGGHPRALEYLDGVLAGGHVRYRDMALRLDGAVRRRLPDSDYGAWRAAHGTMEAGLAETVALVAVDILLGDLLEQLSTVPGAQRLLLGAAVYRERVGLDAVLFQIADDNPTVAWQPDHATLDARMDEIVAAAGVDPADLWSPDQLAEPHRTDLAAAMEESSRPPRPPRVAPADLEARVAACRVTTLLVVDDTGADVVVFVHRSAAAELERRWTASGRLGEVIDAHQRAAAYWRWRVEVYRQAPQTDIHCLLEARHHHLAAGDIDAASDVTMVVCSWLRPDGAFDREHALIHDMLDRLHPDHPDRAVWLHDLGDLAQDRGDLEEAERCYRESLEISERLGIQESMANSYGQLGVLAQDRGDLEEAERCYRESLEISERLGNQYKRARTIELLAILAGEQGDVEASIAGHIDALALGLRYAVPGAARDANRLCAHRAAMGRAEFDTVVARLRDPDLASVLAGVLDQFEDGQRGDDADAPT